MNLGVLLTLIVSVAFLCGAAEAVVDTFGQSRCKEVCIDFSEAADGTKLNHGDYVKYEWAKSRLSMTVTASSRRGGFTPDGQARIFDSSKRNTQDPDLETSTEGNLLIIQEFNNDNTTEPDDNAQGGTFTFSFDSPIYRLLNMTLVDIEVDISFFMLHLAGETGVASQQVLGKGNNTIQTETFERYNSGVESVALFLYGSGGISEICACVEDELPADDLGIRFSKIVWDAEHQPPEEMERRLTPADFPVSGEVAYWLRKSQCWSVIMEEDCFSCEIPFANLIDSIGGPPSHPSRNRNAPFWSEFRAVVDIQRLRLGGTNPRLVMPLAATWQNLTIGEVAEAVHNEYPGYNQAHMIDYLVNVLGAKVDRTIIPSESETEFLREIVMLAEMNTWAISQVGPHNFGIKWSEGRVRPEEVAWMIARNQLTVDDGVPADIVRSIKAMHLKRAVDFTAYPEGCPMHPAWPAMHSAGSAASIWLSVVLNLTEYQSCQAKLVDYDVAFARTVAGVHYPTDNIAGLTLGQELVSHYLPGHLAARYGSNATLVRAKLRRVRFSWTEFALSDCALTARQ